jgi:hypothetical protein
MRGTSQSPDLGSLSTLDEETLWNDTSYHVLVRSDMLFRGADEFGSARLIDMRQMRFDAVNFAMQMMGRIRSFGLISERLLRTS